MASTSYISQESTASKNAHWSAEITLSFSPTSSNYLKWYLMADSSNVNTSKTGYYLLFGGTKRTISFYVLKNGKSTLLHEEQDKLLEASINNVKIDVKRLESDYWTVDYVLNDTLTGVVDFYDDAVNSSSFWGYHCVYTKTRSKSFCFANSKVAGEKASTARQMKWGELVINEVLFNPKDDGVDFLEILNLSDTIFDLSLCKIGNKKQTYDLPKYRLMPDSLVVVTSNAEVLCSQFNCKMRENILQIDKMLPLLNDSGYIRLLSDTVLLDTLFYRSSMHHVLLYDVEGISIERGEDGSFTSASTLFGATPGWQNSVSITSEFNKHTATKDSLFTFSIMSSTASVYDADYPQRVILRYRLQKSARITAKIYTLSGYSVYTLLESELLQGEGKLYWDGRSENSGILPVGIYVIVFEIYTDDAEFYIRKLPVALTP